MNHYLMIFMRKTVFLALACGMCAAVCSAAPKDDVLAAAKKLAQKDNYSWTAAMEVAGANFNLSPLQGKTEKDGFTVLTREFNETTSTAVLKGEKGVIKTEEGWKTADELAPPQGGGGGGGGARGGMMGRMLLRTRTPAAEVESLLEKVKEIKAGEAGMFTAEITEAGAKELISFGGRRPGAAQNQNRPEPKNAKALAKFCVKDGVLTQYELRVQGNITFGQDQQEREMDRTTKVEIKEIGTTKVSVPEEAKKKLSS